MFTIAINPSDFQETLFDPGKSADEQFFGSKCRHEYQYGIEYNSKYEQTVSNAKYLNNLLDKFVGTLHKKNLTNQILFQKMYSYGVTSIELLDDLPYQSATVSIVTEDTIVFKIVMSQNLEIIIVKSFDEAEVDEDEPIITLLEGKSIIFQNRLSISTLVENLLVSTI